MLRPNAIAVRTCALVVADPLCLRDGGLHVRLGADTVPLLMLGEIVPYFLPGWRAAHLYTGFAPMFLLELVHDDGRRATWFLDQRMQQVGDTVDRLVPDLLDLLRHKAVPVLQGLMRTVLHQGSPVLDENSLAFLSVNEATRRAIAIACLDLVLRPPGLCLASDLAEASLLVRGEHDGEHGGGLRAIRRTHVAAGLAEELQDRLPRAFRDGVLAWPSPVDGAVLHAQGGLCFDDFHFAYRFVDARHGLVFFVMVGDHNSRICGVWFPSCGLMVSRDEVARGVARGMLRHMPYWFLTHACQWAAQLVPYLGRGASRFASVMRGRPGVHIGHQLWNELSGIDHLLAGGHRIPPARMPEWLVLNAADGIELYGAVDLLFPALHGHVNRTLANIPALIAHAYAHDVMILRVTREHVSARLRGRILGQVRSSAAAMQARTILGRHAEAAPDAPPVILLGLRVENRTLVDLGGFFTNLVGFLAERFPGATFVVDGHNARGDGQGGRVIESHGESYAGRRPIEFEHDLAAALRTRFAREPVEILDTIGCPMTVSLAWADVCDCFVSVWGASLAKYRWVCNKPGFVLSSRSNLQHRGDLHIYDAPGFMEIPTPLEFCDPELVTDRSEAPLLVNVAPGNASFFNFEVDEEKLFPRIAAMVERSLAVRNHEWLARA